jgi:hypothetical protein
MCVLTGHNCDLEIDTRGIHFYSFIMAFLTTEIRKRSSFSSVLALTLVLAATPAFAGPASGDPVPLGTVLEVKSAQTGPESNSAGATIYDGDRLETKGAGTLRVRLHESQMYLHPGTLTEVHSISNGFSAALMRGAVVVSSPQGQTFQLLSDGATIRPAGSEAAVAQVTWVSPTELQLSSYRGAIQVSLEGDTRTIDAGSSYRMLIEPDDPGPQGNGGSGSGPVAGGRNKMILILIPVVAAVVGVLIWRALESPAAP